MGVEGGVDWIGLCTADDGTDSFGMRALLYLVYGLLVALSYMARSSRLVKE